MAVTVAFKKVWTEIITMENGTVRARKQENVEAIFPDVPAATEYVQGLQMQFIPKGVSIWVSPD